MGVSARALVLVGAFAAVAAAQVPSAPTVPIRTTVIQRDSGMVPAPIDPGHPGLVTVYSTVVTAPQSSWSRLLFGEVTLAGPAGTERAARLRLTSLLDGSSQWLDAQSLAQWGGASAYFNGASVRVELLAAPGTGPSRVVIQSVQGHEPEFVTPQDICLPNDDRVAVADPRMARVLGFGGTIGTAFAFNDTNHFFLTAGHVQPTTGSVMHFNVPASNPDGTINFPPPEDQYPVDPASVQRQTSGTGNDWCYFGTFPNSNTALQPSQVYGGSFFTLAAAPPAPAEQDIRVSGFGSTNGLSLPHEMSFTLTTSTGPYTFSGSTIRYRVDTTGGNSGSAVQFLPTGEVIGIHYLAGCMSGGNPDLGNQATPINNANLQVALNAPIGVCRTGRGTISGHLYALGDLANNFGTASISPLRFARIAQIGSRWQGLTWDRTRNRFFACDGNLNLFTLTTDGQLSPVGPITGTSGQVIHGLGFDPGPRVLYGVAASTGQLYAINTSTAAATPIGAPQGGLVTGLEFDATRQVLWGIENTTQSKLIRINTSTGAQTLIGNIGTASIAQCHGLAVDYDDGSLYTINATSSVLYRLSATTGVGTVVGATLGLFPNAFGMAVANPGEPSCPQDFNGDGTVDPDDLGDYINCYFATPPCPEADFNADGAVDPDDLGDFINAYFGPAC
ncbi:MAG: hypothetical protein AB7K52_11155 [Phycisphaerales bacterium]